MKSVEQNVREILTRAGVKDADKLSSGQLVEIGNMLTDTRNEFIAKAKEDQVERLIQFHIENGLPDRVVIRHDYGAFRVEIFGSHSLAMSLAYCPKAAKTMREAVDNAIKIIEMTGYVEACKAAIEKSKQYHGRD